jgi:hypothetical protein
VEKDVYKEKLSKEGPEHYADKCIANIDPGRGG